MSDINSTGRIVVGVDGSAGSKLALEWASRLATALGAQIDVVAAWDYPLNVGWAVEPQHYNLAQEMQKAATEVVDDVFGGAPPPGLRITVSEGTAAQVLVEQSTDALMVVLGSRGHGGFMGLLLGSVSARVAEHAKCPVLVAHGGTARPFVPVTPVEVPMEAMTS